VVGGAIAQFLQRALADRVPAPAEAARRSPGRPRVLPRLCWWGGAAGVRAARVQPLPRPLAPAQPRAGGGGIRAFPSRTRPSPSGWRPQAPRRANACLPSSGRAWPTARPSLRSPPAPPAPPKSGPSPSPPWTRGPGGGPCCGRGPAVPRPGSPASSPTGSLGATAGGAGASSSPPRYAQRKGGPRSSTTLQDRGAGGAASI